MTTDVATGHGEEVDDEPTNPGKSLESLRPKPHAPMTLEQRVARTEIRLDDHGRRIARLDYEAEIRETVAREERRAAQELNRSTRRLVIVATVVPLAFWLSGVAALAAYALGAFQ